MCVQWEVEISFDEWIDEYNKESSEDVRDVAEGEIGEYVWYGSVYGCEKEETKLHDDATVRFDKFEVGYDKWRPDWFGN